MSLCCHLLLALLFLNSTLAAVGLDDAKGYHNNSSLQWQWAISALEKQPWTGTERVLDIGSGDGKVSAFMADNCTKGLVVGYDISENMVQFSSNLFKKEHFPNLLYLKGDIKELPFYGQFDIVTAFCALHYVVEQEEALQKIHTSLAPHGKLLIVGPGRDSTSVANIAEELIKSKKWLPHFPSFKKARVYYTMDEYLTLLTSAGFEPIYSDVTHDKVRFQDKEALLRWLKPLINYTSHLSQELQYEFLSDIADVMLKAQIPTDDGTILLESTLFEIACERR